MDSNLTNHARKPTPEDRTDTKPIQYPPTEAEGYPPPFPPRLSSSFVEIDFFIPKKTTSQPELACTVKLCKADCNLGIGDFRIRKNKATAHDLKAILKGDRSVIISCHGFLSWRNQMILSHMAAGVAERNNCHAVRFDFQGNGSSGGGWRMANYAGELSDLQRVVSFVETDLGCNVACIIGHSKGSVAVLQYAQQQSLKNQSAADEKGNCCFVNLSGRYTSRGNFDPKTIFTEAQIKTLAEKGSFKLKSPGGRALDVTAEDIDERANLEMSFVSNISQRVLTIHGDADTTVDVDSAYTFDDKIPKHSLKVIPNADHNFNGLRYLREIVSAIADFVV